MAQIEGEIVIRRPVEQVFDFVADERNEPSFNDRMFRAELVVAGADRGRVTVPGREHDDGAHR